MGVGTRCVIVLLVVMVSVLSISSVFLSLDYITEDFRKMVTNYIVSIQIPDITNKDENIRLLEMLYFSTKLEGIDRIFGYHDYPHTFVASVFDGQLFISVKLYTYLGYIEKSLEFYCDRVKCTSGYFSINSISVNQVEIIYSGYNKMRRNTIYTNGKYYELTNENTPLHSHAITNMHFVVGKTCPSLYIPSMGSYKIIRNEKYACSTNEDDIGREVLEKKIQYMIIV